MTFNTLIIIPARMASTRLPGKPLADIAGKPMIAHVGERATAAKQGRVVIATDHDDIADAAASYGYEAVVTKNHHESGSDRIYETLMTIDPHGHYDTIINVQGDLPTIAPDDIASALKPLDNKHVDIATLGTIIKHNHDTTNPNIVKIVGSPLSSQRLRALYFTRATAPHGDGPLYHHIGLYAYRRQALEQFVHLPPSALEKRERLEQLRALESAMRIDVELINAVPLSVDTQQDLEKARQQLLTANKAL